MADVECSDQGIPVTAWPRRSSEAVGDYRVFRVKRELCLDPRDNSEHSFFVIEAPDWINVVPVTTDGRIILIEQYRQGTGEVTLEIPGGMVDENESPADAAARELLEETGYRAGRLELLGRTRPNPALQNNWLHTFVARDCLATGSQKLDAAEHIAVRLVAPDEAMDLIKRGVIDHALVVAAFYLFSKTQ
jgi:ADP-ribose pyrophosphatase